MARSAPRGLQRGSQGEPGPHGPPAPDTYTTRAERDLDAILGGRFELDAPGSLWVSCKAPDGSGTPHPRATVQVTATTLNTVAVDPPGLIDAATAFPAGQGGAIVYH